MFEGYPEDEKEEIRRRGGQNSSLDSKTAAKNGMEHGLFSRCINYYRNLPKAEREFLNNLYNVMLMASNIPEHNSEKAVAEKGVLRDEIINYWKVKKYRESDFSKYDSKKWERLNGESRRVRRCALEKFREFDLIEEGEQSIERYYPGGGEMYS